MSFLLTEEQKALRSAAQEFAQTRMPVTHLRALRDGADAVGFSRARWTEMAALGWTGSVIPEAYGGSGLGFSELGIVLRALGATLAPQPFLSTIALAATAIAHAGSESQKSEWLPSLASGGSIVGWAHDESTRHDPYRVALAAMPAPTGISLTGTKTFVLDGHVADAFLVVARSAGTPGDREGLSLCRVAREARGMTVTRSSIVDARNVATVRFDGVEVSHANLVGAPGLAADTIDFTLDRATAALTAEMLGGAEEAFDRTVAYLKTRRQFGVPIGSFQALKHRAAQMFCELELAKSIVVEALAAIDEGRSDASELVSAAKARMSDVYILVTNEAVQMHGGVGVTDELDIGLFLKRARVAQRTLGDAAYHRDRYARLRGY